MEEVGGHGLESKEMSCDMGVWQSGDRVAKRRGTLIQRVNSTCYDARILLKELKSWELG